MKMEQQPSEIKKPASELASSRTSVDVPPIGTASQSLTGAALQPNAA
jgi:hypothetical protein